MKWVVVVILCLSFEFSWLQGTRGRSGRRGRRGARGKRVQWLARNLNLMILLCDCDLILSCTPDVLETTAVLCIKLKHLWFISFISNISTCPAIVFLFFLTTDSHLFFRSACWCCCLKVVFENGCSCMSCLVMLFTDTHWAEIEMEFCKLASVTVTRLHVNWQFPVF